MAPTPAENTDATGQRELNKRLNACWDSYLKKFMPTMLLVALLWGLVWPQPEQAIAAPSFPVPWSTDPLSTIKTIAVVLVFILQGLTLKTDEFVDGLKAWRASLFGIASIIGITPLLGLVVFQLPFLHLSVQPCNTSTPAPFEPPVTPMPFLPPTPSSPPPSSSTCSPPSDVHAIQTGFLLFCAVPTTIYSGVLLSTQAGGNSALALLMTLATNMIGIFIVPPYFGWMLSLGLSGIGGVHLPGGEILITLLLEVLLPTIIGKILCDRVSAVVPFLKPHKKKLVSHE